MAVRDREATSVGNNGDDRSAQEDSCSDRLIMISSRKGFGSFSPWLHGSSDNDSEAGRKEIILALDSPSNEACHRSRDVVELEMPAASFLEQDLWEQAEKIMLAKHPQVIKVLEDFGIANVKPATDVMEEQLWQVVLREITFHEASDLV